jgi:hypothetical protein
VRIRWFPLAIVVALVVAALALAPIGGVFFGVASGVLFVFGVGVVASHFNVWGGPFGSMRTGDDRNLDPDLETEFKRPRNEGDLL